MIAVSQCTGSTKRAGCCRIAKLRICASVIHWERPEQTAVADAWNSITNASEDDDHGAPVTDWSIRRMWFGRNWKRTDTARMQRGGDRPSDNLRRLISIQSQIRDGRDRYCRKNCRRLGQRQLACATTGRQPFTNKCDCYYLRQGCYILSGIWLQWKLWKL